MMENNKYPNVILPVPNVSATITFAAEELQKYLVRIFPQKLTDQISCTLQLLPSGISNDGFTITGNSSSLRIAACCDRGLLHGVYRLLRGLGCCFLFPGPSREHIPQLTAWPYDDALDISEEPWLEYRGLCLFHATAQTLIQTKEILDWMPKNGFNFLLTSFHREDDTTCGDHAIFWDETGDELYPEIQKRGIVLDMSEHSTTFYFPAETHFKSHPDWFAEISGVRRPGQLCYSNAEAVEAYGHSLCEFARDKPWFQYLGIWPLDGGGYCECENCSDPQAIFRADAVIAGMLKKVRPDLIVEHLAYTPQSFSKPDQEMPDNMSVLVCGKRDRIAYEWAAASKNASGAFFFDYMTADHYRYRSNVTLDPVYCRETVNTLASYGYRGMISLYLPVDCWWQSSINLWCLNRFCYEPGMKMSQLYTDLAAALFGSSLAQQGAVLMQKICDELLSPVLWSGFPHAQEWFCEHMDRRNRKLDAKHADVFDQIFKEVKKDLDMLQSGVSAEYDSNCRHMRTFLELQYLYLHCIDQYDADTDTPERAEPYFTRLAELEMTDSPFITERYARWRITGRDNIFDISAENLFQAREE